MTIEEIIREADGLKPNAFPEEAKARWISEAEGSIAANVLLLAPEELRKLQYVWPKDRDARPLLEPPYDALYLQWLLAKIDEANGEYDKYANAMAVYNAVYSGFLRWFCNLYDPAQGYRPR